MNKIDELVEKRVSGDFEDPIGFDQYIALFVELLGDDEAEVLNFINNATEKQGMVLYEAYEEIVRQGELMGKNVSEQELKSA